MANRDPELSERPEGAIEHEPLAVIAPATAEVLGVPLALTDYERTLDWLDATVAGWNQAPTPFTWAGKRQERRQRARHRRLGGSGATLPDPQLFVA